MIKDIRLMKKLRFSNPRVRVVTTFPGNETTPTVCSVVVLGQSVIDAVGLEQAKFAADIIRAYGAAERQDGGDARLAASAVRDVDAEKGA